MTSHEDDEKIREAARQCALAVGGSVADHEAVIRSVLIDFSRPDCSRLNELMRAAVPNVGEKPHPKIGRVPIQPWRRRHGR